MIENLPSSNLFRGEAIRLVSPWEQVIGICLPIN
jgi:hypothetical protein